MENAIRLAPVEVRAGSEEVLDFQRATSGALRPETVPFVYPIRWLALPEIKARLVECIGPSLLPIQESQTFTSSGSLELERDYLLSVELARSSNPARLRVLGTVTARDGDVRMRFETILRLVRLDGEGPAGHGSRTESQ